jgi:hypothetical protein
MISREVLLGLLNRSVDEEERSLAFYAQHEGDPAFLAELPPNERARITEILKLLQSEAVSSAETYRGLVKIVNEAVQDAF